ncbi:MAG: hypothetical protein JWM80_665 [Cyanobacteria bacterium RYN_339]|nr:hypothetical protein [Cyanobacteria bacterium RYN_339]
MIDRGRVSIFKLEPRVEILVRACRTIGMAVQGPEEGTDYQYELSPRTEQVVTYLVGKMPTDEHLTRQVQGAMLQFYGAKRAIEQAEVELLGRSLQEQNVESLKHALFFLSRFGIQFKDDPALQQVFPSPVSVQAPVPAAPRPMAPSPPRAPSPQPSSAPASNDPLILKVANLMGYLAPKMEVVRLALAMMDPTQVTKVNDIMSANAKIARTLGTTIKRQNRTLMSNLTEAYNIYVLMTRDFRTTLPGGLPDATKQNYFRLRVFTMSFLKEPLLRDLFPPSEKAKLADA